jgi:hypothetical protein
VRWLNARALLAALTPIAIAYFRDHNIIVFKIGFLVTEDNIWRGEDVFGGKQN